MRSRGLCGAQHEHMALPDANPTDPSKYPSPSILDISCSRQKREYNLLLLPPHLILVVIAYDAFFLSSVAKSQFTSWS